MFSLPPPPSPPRRRPSPPSARGSWIDAADPAGLAALDAFLRRLRASGGGDFPEDATGGLAAAGRLFDLLGEPSLRVCLLLADAPCHGLAGSGDAHGGPAEAARARAVVRRVFAEGGAELVVCDASGRRMLEGMAAEFDRVLGEAHSYVDQVSHAAA
jgi:hypothetical protein